MNASIKRRQTLLVSWLSKKLQATLVANAITGSRYVEFKTQHTSEGIIRFSDHLSPNRDCIHVILSPLNSTVIINYKNFIWSGNFAESKSILYTLIMSTKMQEEAIAKEETTFQSCTKVKKVIPIETAISSWNKEFRPKIYEWIKCNPNKVDLMSSFLHSNGSCNKAAKAVLLVNFLKKH